MALQSSGTPGRRTGTWKGTATPTKPSTITSVSFMCLIGHIRTRSTVCEGIPQSLQLDGALNPSLGLLYVYGGVPIRQRRPLHRLHRHRSKF